jgi:hypothetical protein
MEGRIAPESVFENIAGRIERMENRAREAFVKAEEDVTRTNTTVEQLSNGFKTLEAQQRAVFEKNRLIGEYLQKEHQVRVRHRRDTDDALKAQKAAIDTLTEYVGDNTGTLRWLDPKLTKASIDELMDTAAGLTAEQEMFMKATAEAMDAERARGRRRDAQIAAQGAAQDAQASFLNDFWRTADTPRGPPPGIQDLGDGAMGGGGMGAPGVIPAPSAPSTPSTDAMSMQTPLWTVGSGNSHRPPGNHRFFFADGPGSASPSPSSSSGSSMSVASTPSSGGPPSQGGGGAPVLQVRDRNDAVVHSHSYNLRPQPRNRPANLRDYQQWARESPGSPSVPSPQPPLGMGPYVQPPDGMGPYVAPPAGMGLYVPPPPGMGAYNALLGGVQVPDTEYGEDL